MDLSEPLSVVTPTLDGAVLAALLTVETVETGAGIHRRAGAGTAHGVRKVLRRLVSQGIVEQVDASTGGTAYRLNREHIAYDAVVALASVRSGLVARLAQRLQTWPDVLHASLPPFGPGNPLPAHPEVMVAARAAGRHYTADPDADFSTPGVVRLVLVAEDKAAVDTPEWRYGETHMAAKVVDWTGNEAQFEVVTLDELARRVREQDPVVQQWRRTNVHVHGVPLGELLGRV